MHRIEARKNKDGVLICVPFEVCDELDVRAGGKVGIKKKDGYLFIYRIWDMDDTENGYTLIKNQRFTKGYTLIHKDLKQYMKEGDEYEVDFDDPVWDELNEKDLFQLVKC